jgi:hypothetical protein
MSELTTLHSVITKYTHRGRSQVNSWENENPGPKRDAKPLTRPQMPSSRPSPDALWSQVPKLVGKRTSMCDGTIYQAD